MSPRNPTTIRVPARRSQRGPQSVTLTPADAPREDGAEASSSGLAPRLDWDALTPRSFYARFGQPLLDLALLIVVLPPAVVLGLAVALCNWVQFRDVRRIFFVQPRLGCRGREFLLVKFRTMSAAREGNFAAWEKGDSLRVTRFGRVLRSTHLDELPQLVNIALGDMNFIGPRPEMLEVEQWASEHVPAFSTRLALRPGLTGLAQITQGYTGRDVAAYSEKLAINDHYRRNVSLWMDLSILARTAVWMMRGRGWAWNRSRPDAPAAAETREISD